MKNRNTSSSACGSALEFSEGQLQSFMATCPRGVEYVLANELRELGAGDVVESIAAVYFSATRELAWSVCIWTRVASRIVLLLGRGMTNSLDDFQQKLRSLQWADWFGSDRTFAIDFNGTNTFVRNSRYGAQLCKDAINDAFAAAGESRPSVDLQQPDILVYARLFKNRYAIGLDMAGESLHRRAYRQQGGAAPLKENLAAALLLMADWPSIAKAGGGFVDPMCGSGTLVIEAALIALNIPPSVRRSHWLLENFRAHDAGHWNAFRQTELDKADRALSNSGVVDVSIRGFDVNQETVQFARDNCEAAGLEDFVEFRQVAITDLNVSKTHGTGLVLTNPPYGKRLGESGELAPLYQGLGDWLKRDCMGWQAAIFTGNPDLGWSTGLRSWRQHHLFNGAIACDLQRYRIEQEEFRQPRLPEKETGASGAPGLPSQPTEESLGEQARMLANRLRKNEARLKNWLRQSDVSCYRLYDADLPNYAVAIDIYRGSSVTNNRDASSKSIVAPQEVSTCFHIQEYAPPRQVDPGEAKKRLDEVSRVIRVIYGVDESVLFVKQRRRQRGAGQYLKLDGSTADIVIREGGHQFLANLGRYLDTGIFLDHRLVRREIARHAKGVRFLNLFAYTATSTVYAAKSGARSSVSVDMSKTYLRWARRNFELNGLSLVQHQLIEADCLDWLQQHDKKYELILLDPPSFSNSSRMEQTLDIQRDHRKLIEECMRLLSPEGTVYFSCNRRGFKLDTGLLSLYRIENITSATLPPDYAQKGVAHQCWRLAHRSD